MSLLVSVVMPAYNAERHLAAAIESVLAQTYPHFELLVIDDGSTDNTAAIAAAFAAKDSRVKVITHENWGMGRSTNHAAELARGDWIVRLDADDVMLPQRIEKQLDFLALNPDLMVAASLVDFIDDAGRVIGRTKPHWTKRQDVAAAVAAHRVVGFTHPSVIYNKLAIQHVGGFRPQFWPCDDLDLWNRVVEAGYMAIVQEEVLTQYRIHATSVCVAKSRSTIRRAGWVEACVVARRTGKPEPTWEQFEADRAALPPLKRWAAGRAELASSLWKNAVIQLSTRRYVPMVASTLAAAALDPGLILSRVLPRLGLRVGHA
jgi:glycosyltransferase involved in cell wall biosynthesis